MPNRVFCDALDNSQHPLEIYPSFVYMPSDTGDMLSSNNSTLGVDSEAAAAAIPIVPSRAPNESNRIVRS